MTRDSAVVAVLDDRRRRLCPASATAAAGEGASPPTVAAASGSSSGGAGCDEGTSSKSSSAASTTTSCCGSSGSDDDDFAAVRCPAGVRRPVPVHDDDDDDDARPASREDVAVAHRRSPSGGRLDDATVAPANIGGRLTFYKDGKFIFQLAAHQKHSYSNQSAIMSPCRWVPVPTVIQQHKNNVKMVGESSLQHPQNKTIWPYLVTDQPTSNSKSPQPIHQSQSLVAMKSGDRRLQQMQLSQSRTTPPPSKPFSGAVNLLGFNNSVVTATTQNIVRRPSRKYSTSTSVENVSDLQHQNRQPQSLQIRNSSKLSQHHQNQSFMMVATKAVKSLRRSKQRNSCHLKATGKTESMPPKSQQPPLVNLEQIVRHLWCRRHTSELLRRQLSLNNNLESAISTSSLASQRDSNDSSCSNMMMGSGKRRSLMSPLSTNTTTSNESRMSTSIEDGSPYKKYKLRQQQQQQQIIVNHGAKIGASTVSANDHSITAILSGNATGTKRSSDVISSMIDSNTCFSTNTTSTYSNSVIMPQKNILPTQPSLLRTLLKSPSSEIVSQSVAVGSNDSGYAKHNTFSSRKRSAIELTSLASASEVNKCSSMTAPLLMPPTVSSNAANNVTALNSTFQLPTLHPAATDQLTAAGYFNVLYHQAAMAAAMVYQNNSQLPQTVLKPTPLLKPQPSSLLSSQFSNTNGANNTWQQQLNQRPPLLPLPEMVTGSEIASAVTISSSSSTIVAPHTSPLTTVIVNSSSGLMPSSIPSPPPLLKHSIHHRNTLLKQYQQTPSVHQPSLYHKIKLHQMGSGVKKNIEDCVGYGANITEKYEVDRKKSASSVDCMPLNLSKDSMVENADSASTTVR